MKYAAWLEHADPEGGPARPVSHAQSVELACAAMLYEAMPGGLICLDGRGAGAAARALGCAVVNMESWPGKYRRLNIDGNTARYDQTLVLLHALMRDCETHGRATMRVTAQ